VKNFGKLLLDAAMLLVLILMYQKQVISMTFHEAGGLAVLGLFAVHLVINHKWIAAVTKKLFSKAVPLKTRAGYLVNVLLLVSFVLIGLSGIMISKQLFSLRGGNNFITMHYASAAFALILMGIHIALHWRFITGVIKKRISLSGKIAKPAGIMLAAAIFFFGLHSIANTSFLQWLTMPFRSQGGGMEMRRNEGRPGLFGEDISENLTHDSSVAAGNEGIAENTALQQEANASEGTGGNNLLAGTEQNSGDSFPRTNAAKSRPDGFQMGHQGGEMQGFSLLNVLSVIARYGSITGMVAVAAVLFGKIAGRFRKRESACWS
jgi:hypothetical protein